MSQATLNVAHWRTVPKVSTVLDALDRFKWCCVITLARVFPELFTFAGHARALEHRVKEVSSEASSKLDIKVDGTMT